jgi:hypothetical protein
MEVVGVVKDGKVELPASVHLPEGAEVRVIVTPDALTATQPFESEPIAETSVLADIAWATGHRFNS